MKGQTLLEALLAISVVMIVLSGIAATTISSLNNAGYGKTQSMATQYAQDGIEVLRKIRSSNYGEFRSYNGNYCLSKGATSLQAYGTCSTPNVDNYIRSINIEQSGCGTNVAKATVNVAWTDTKCANGTYCHSSKLVSCFSTVPTQQGFSTQPQVPNPNGPTPTPTGPVVAGSTSVAISITPTTATSSQFIRFSVTVTGTNCQPSGSVYFNKNGQPFLQVGLNSSNPATGYVDYPAWYIGAGTYQVYANYPSSGSTCPSGNSPQTTLVIN